MSKQSSQAFDYKYNETRTTHVDPEQRRLNDSLFKHADWRTRQLIERGDQAQPWALDLFRIAKAVYLADRMSAREKTVDRWTRKIHLDITLTDAEAWSEEVREDVHQMLRILTGDVWSIQLHGGAHGPQGRIDRGEVAERVALFSGGLDSTTYAAEHAGDQDVRFLRWTTSGLGRIQEQVLHQIGVNPELVPAISMQVRRKIDISSRSRGFLFLASAIYAATAFGARTVIVPENGQLAVNPPLTRARRSSCSTRTVHPQVLALLNRIIAAVGAADVRVENPYLYLTKGEVCRRALSAGLDADALGATVSCGHPPRVRKDRENHCGYCVPCLLRRSALLASAGDKTRYKYDFWSIDLGDGKADDPKALCTWLFRPFTERDLAADVSVGDSASTTQLMNMLRAGRRELTSMVKTLVPTGHPLRVQEPPDATPALR